MYKNRSQGFTLIELLVVIAIIGILSAVVLASLNTARNRGNDAAIQSDLSTVHTEAEIQYGTLGNSYNTGVTITSNICSTLITAGSIFADVTIQKALIGAKTVAGGTDSSCGVSSSAYAIASNLATGGAWCIDSTGVSRKTNTSNVPYTSSANAITTGQTYCN